MKLRPELLGTIQKEVAEHFGLDHRPFDLVMHGGSGSTAEEIATAVANGVIKMNVDTDTQYAFTRPVVDHMMRNYDGVLKIDGEVGVKKQYDPRTWGKVGRGRHGPPARRGLPAPGLRRHPDALNLSLMAA